MSVASCERFATLSLFLLPVLIAVLIVARQLSAKHERNYVAYSRYMAASRAFYYGCIVLFLVNSIIIVVFRKDVGILNVVTTLIYAFATTFLILFE